VKVWRSVIDEIKPKGVGGPGDDGFESLLYPRE
jgi:hypothetical protein